jgi:hypothetical protein
MDEAAELIAAVNRQDASGATASRESNAPGTDNTSGSRTAAADQQPQVRANG